MSLTPQQIQDGLDAAAALFRGERIEYFNPAAGRWLETRNINAAFHHRPVRKPEPRPWSKPEDVPGPVCWIRGSSDPNRVWLITRIAPSAVHFSGNTYHYEQLSSYEYSTDRKTWKPCVVEVAE